LEQTSKEDERSDLKQHADKMLREILKSLMITLQTEPFGEPVQNAGF
jgi:hypothetical protein